MNTLVTEVTEHGEIPVDVYQKLANDRILFIYDYLDDKLASELSAIFLLKGEEDPEEPITLLINCEGGDIRAVLMVYDVMQLLSCPIKTICVGSACQEAVILLSSGTKGMRFATENSLITASQLYHQSVSISDMTDTKSFLEQAKKDNDVAMTILAKNTNKTKKEIMTFFERKKYFTSKQAKKFGLIDKIVPKKSDHKMEENEE